MVMNTSINDHQDLVDGRWEKDNDLLIPERSTTNNVYSTRKIVTHTGISRRDE